MLTFSSMLPNRNNQNDVLFINSTIYNISVNRVFFLDTRSGEFSLSIPDSISSGDSFVFIDIYGTLDIEPVRIINFKKIFSNIVSDFYLDKKYCIYYFTYVDSAIGWIYNTSYLALSNNTPIDNVLSVINSQKNIVNGIVGLDSEGKIPATLINTSSSNLQPIILSTINSQKNIVNGIVGLGSNGKIPTTLIEDNNGIIGDAIGSYLIFPKGGTPLEPENYIKINADTTVNSNQYPLLNQSLNQPDYSFILTDKVVYPEIQAVSNQYFGYSCEISDDGKFYSIGAPHGGNSTGFGEIHIYSNLNNNKSNLRQIIKPKGDFIGFGKLHSMSGDGKTLAICSSNESSTQVSVTIFKNKASDSDIYVEFMHIQTIINADISFAGWKYDRRNAMFLNNDGSLLFIGCPDEGKVYIYKYNGTTTYTLFKTILIPNSDINPVNGKANLFGVSIAIDSTGNYIAISDYLSYDLISGTYQGKIYFYNFNSSNQTYELKTSITNITHNLMTPSTDNSYHCMLGYNLCMSKQIVDDSINGSHFKLFSSYTNGVNGGNIVVFSINSSSFIATKYDEFFHPEPTFHIPRTFRCDGTGNYLLCSIYRWWNSPTGVLDPRGFLTLLVNSSVISGFITIPGTYDPIPDDNSSLFSKIGNNNIVYYGCGCISADRMTDGNYRLINTAYNSTLYSGTDYLVKNCGFAEQVLIGGLTGLINERNEIPYIWNINISEIYAGSFENITDGSANSQYLSTGNGFNFATCLVFYEIVNKKLLIRGAMGSSSSATPVSPVLCETQNIAFCKEGVVFKYLNDIDGWKQIQNIDTEFTISTAFPIISKTGKYLASSHLVNAKVVLFKYNSITNKYDHYSDLINIPGISDSHFGVWDAVVCFSPLENIVFIQGIIGGVCKNYIFEIEPTVSLLGTFENSHRFGQYSVFSHDAKFIVAANKIFELKKTGNVYSLDLIVDLNLEYNILYSKFINNSYNIIGINKTHIIKLEYDSNSSSKYRLVTSIDSNNQNMVIMYNINDNDIIVLSNKDSSLDSTAYRQNKNFQYFSGGDFKIIYAPPGIDNNDFYVKVK